MNRQAVINDAIRLYRAQCNGGVDPKTGAKAEDVAARLLTLKGADAELVAELLAGFGITPENLAKAPAVEVMSCGHPVTALSESDPREGDSATLYCEACADENV